jgi:DNA replication and repair protein RecF
VRLRLTALAARGFRNLGAADWTFDTPWTGFVGPNGSGKTNTIEALHVLCRLRGFRGEQPGRLRAWSGEDTVLSGCFDVEGRRQDRRLLLDGRQSVRTCDGDPVDSPRRWATAVPLFGYRPDDDLFFHEEPQERRRHLDWFCSYRDAEYMRAAAAYERNLRQRAQALRGHWRGPELAVWEDALAETGAALTRARAQAVLDLGRHFGELARSLPLVGLELAYRSGGDADPQVARAALAAGRSRDADLGRTGFGPHRDDLSVSLGGRPIRQSGSQGQRKLAVITLALACALASGEGRNDGARTLFYLDDIEGELDAANEEALFALLAELPLQGLVTGVREPAGFRRPGLEAVWHPLPAGSA